MNDLDLAIAEVVKLDNCSGCGGCLALDAGLELAIDDHGFARPTRVGPSTALATAASVFAESCPGVKVSAPRTRRHPTMGPVVAAWQAWAADPEIRRAGSSGGALTALASWLVSSGQAQRVVGAAQSPDDAKRSVSVSITSREEALAAASSRYAPVTGRIDADGSPVIGPPCRSSAIRSQTDDAPLLLSFFCAGVPSQWATDSLVAELAPGSTAQSLRYRGDGWPGRFTVETVDGATASLSYEESWGAHLGRALQWRCKICVDGVGESADVVAADLWHSDDRGFPLFEELDGVSALIARTPRGLALVKGAIAAGAIVATPLAIQSLAAVQPFQVVRRTTLAGRILGAWAAGSRVPRYRGFGLIRLALPRWRETIRVARGTFRRRARHSP